MPTHLMSLNVKLESLNVLFAFLAEILCLTSVFFPFALCSDSNNLVALEI